MDESDAIRYFTQENYKKALEIFLDNLEEAKIEGNVDRIAYNANFAALCLYFMHRPMESFQYFDIALENTEGEERRKVERNLDEVRRYIERINRDIEELKSMLEDEQDRSKRGIILSNLGLLHYFLGNVDEAEKNLMEAERIFRDGDKIALGAIYTNFAMLYDDMRKLDYLYRALDIFEGEGHIKGQVDVYHALALYYLHREEYEESYYFLKREIELLGNIDDEETKKRAYELAADVAMNLGKVDEALKFTENAVGD